MLRRAWMSMVARTTNKVMQDSSIAIATVERPKGLDGKELDRLIKQIEAQWSKLGQLKEKVVRKTGQYEITLEMKPKQTAATDPPTLSKMSTLRGVGQGISLVEARLLAKQSFARTACQQDGIDPASTFKFVEPHPAMDTDLMAEVNANTAGTFVKTYTDSWKISRLEEQCVACKGLFHIALTLQIPENHRTDRAETDRVHYAIGVASATSKARARTAAKIDLVKRILPHVKDTEHLLKGKPIESALANAEGKNQKPLLVEFPENIIAEAKSMFEAISFQSTLMASAPLPSRYKKNLHPRSFPEYSKEDLTEYGCLGIPDRFQATRHLPIFERYHEILQTIQSHQVTVLSAATGSGKTTQVPQFILALYEHFRPRITDYHVAPQVIVTQPRRIAAISVAQRIAKERNEHMGSDSSIGYAVRFQVVPPSGRSSAVNGQVLLCTAGILLKKLQFDSFLAECSHLIIDEVHERDVFSDILLMLSKGLLRIRPDIKIILMSATVEAEKFATYFSDDGFTVGRVLDVAGTNYPVETVYLPQIVNMIRPKLLSPETDAYLEAERDLSEGNAIVANDKLAGVPIDIIGSLIGRIHKSQPPGAILCFLPGWDEMMSVQEYLEQNGLLSGSYKLYLLHSNSPQGAPDELFVRAPDFRKIILSTNIAESSITIPDVVYVIDSAKQKTTFYDAKHRMNILESCWISQSNMKQRMGRAGRCQSGQYFVLISKDRALGLNAQFPPELSRLNLDEVCLGIRAAGVTEPCESFLSKALDPPEPRAVRESIKELQAIQALDQCQQLTPLGRLLANIPIHPRTSKMLVVAAMLRAVDPIEVITASLGEKLTKSMLMTEAKRSMNKFMRNVGRDTHSDHMTIFRVFDRWSRRDRSMMHVFSEHGLNRLDKSRSSIQNVIHGQLLRGCDGFEENSNNTAVIRFILTSGFYPDLAFFTRKRNTFRLPHVRGSVTLATTSVNAVLSARVQSNDVDEDECLTMQRAIRKELADRPLYYIYEELFDAGTKKIMKTTAIDPLWCIIFGENVHVTLMANETMHVIVDEVVQFRGPAASIRLMMDMRLFWRKYLQFFVEKKLSDIQMSAEEQAFSDRFRAFLVKLISENTNIYRPHITS